MDGTNISVLHSSGLLTPYAIAIDYNSQVLYWADYGLRHIEMSSVDGLNRAVVTAVNVYYPWNLVFYDDQLFWAERSISGVRSASTISPDVTMDVVSGLSGTVYQVQIIASDRQNTLGKKTSCSQTDNVIGNS